MGDSGDSLFKIAVIVLLVLATAASCNVDYNVAKLGDKLVADGVITPFADSAANTATSGPLSDKAGDTP